MCFCISNICVKDVQVFIFLYTPWFTAVNGVCRLYRIIEFDVDLLGKLNKKIMYCLEISLTSIKL